jgi:hypothetical protein
MRMLLILFVGLILTSQAVFAEEITSPVAAEISMPVVQEVTILEPAAISTLLPTEPELKYLDSAPMSLEAEPIQLNTAINSQTEASMGGLLIPEMTAPIAEPEIAKMEIPQAPDSSLIKEISPIDNNGFQANIGE